jgi:hypothetical protein
MSKIKLGYKVKDTITGFEGITISKTEYLHGCTQWGVKSKGLHEGKPIPMQWFDDPRLEVVKKLKVERREGSDPTPGGPKPTPPSRSHSSSD